MKTSLNYFFKRLRYWCYAVFDKGRLRKFPVELIIEPTNICTLRCSCCPNGDEKATKRPLGIMSRETFDEILNNIDIPIKKVYLYLHGEPFVNKNLEYFVSRLKEKNIMAHIFSNGYNIETELLKPLLHYGNARFTFSMDLLSKEYYESIRVPAKYEDAMTCLRELNTVFAQHKRKFEINIIADKFNAEVKSFALNFIKEYDSVSKINFGVKFPWPRYFHTVDLNNRLSKYYGFCTQMRSPASVYWDGRVSLCSFDFSGELIAGDMTKMRLSEVYNSKDALKIRRLHYLCRRDKLPVCRECVLPRFLTKSHSVLRKEVLLKK